FLNFQTAFRGPLIDLGLETVAVSTKFAAEPKKQEGLLVVSVVPDSIATNGGVREGDIIELIDGQPAMRTMTPHPALRPDQKHSLSIVRGQQHLQVVLAPVVKP